MQHPKTKSTTPDVDPFGAEPLVGSGFENEPGDAGFDTDLAAEPQPGEEDYQ
ncbi:MAG: hypothetical protein ACLQKA_12765 [Bryobacteraceae bacterium]